MITRRDLAVALIAVTCTVGAFAVADELPLIGSSVFDWNSIPAKLTEVGSVILQSPHANTGTTGGTRHHVESGKVAAPATSPSERGDAHYSTGHRRSIG